MEGFHTEPNRTCSTENILSLKWKWTGVTRSHRWMNMNTSFSIPILNYVQLHSFQFCQTGFTWCIQKCAVTQCNFTLWTSCRYPFTPLEPNIYHQNESFFPYVFSEVFSLFSSVLSPRERGIHPGSRRATLTQKLEKCSREWVSFPMLWKRPNFFS